VLNVRKTSPCDLLTADEMLAAFRSRCHLKMYMFQTLNTSNYGIKIIILEDEKMHYSECPCILCQGHTPDNTFSVIIQHVVNLIPPVVHTNRTVTGDNFIISAEL
jgi:hypothetical protein